MRPVRRYFFFKQTFQFGIILVVILIAGIVRFAASGAYSTLLIGLGWLLFGMVTLRWLVIDQSLVAFRGLFQKVELPWSQIKQVRNDYPHIVLVEKKTFQEEIQLTKRIRQDPKNFSKNLKEEDDFWLITVTPKEMVNGKAIPSLIKELATDASFDDSVLRLHQQRSKFHKNS